MTFFSIIELQPVVKMARAFAHAAHASINQRRKYSGEPYYAHTDAVAKLLGDYSPNIQAAAHLHDYIEDVAPITIGVPKATDVLRRTFGAEITTTVEELTDLYTAANYPRLNRKARKHLEATRLHSVSFAAQIIKVADLISNTDSITEHDPTFAKIYLSEKRTIVGGLALVRDEPLFARALEQIEAFNATLPL